MDHPRCSTHFAHVDSPRTPDTQVLKFPGGRAFIDVVGKGPLILSTSEPKGVQINRNRKGQTVKPDTLNPS
jgi:hypothetical protein